MTDLQTRIDAVMALDEKRNEHEAKVADPDGITSSEDVWHFYQSAPSMVQIIREQQTEIDKRDDVIAKLHEALEKIKSRIHAERYECTPLTIDDADTDAEKELMCIIDACESTACEAIALSAPLVAQRKKVGA